LLRTNRHRGWRRCEVNLGEARKRKAHDPNYGKVPKAGISLPTHASMPSPVDAVPRLGKFERGLVISPPVELDLAANMLMSKGAMDLAALRLDLLFWDRLARPDGPIGFPRTPEEDFLETVSVLFAPRYPGFSGGMEDIVFHTHLQGFFDLDQREPGSWALSQGSNSVLVRDGILVEGRGVTLTLLNAIPVPDVTVALQDVLEFRVRRRDEMLALRSEIENFYSLVLAAEDQDLALLHYKEKVEAACIDILRVAKERQFPIRMGDWSASIDMNEAGFQAIKTWGLAQSVGMDALTSAFVLKVNLGLGLARSRIAKSPYRYVAHIHRDLM
jgi:Family of unknown function (DUF6236)